MSNWVLKTAMVVGEQKRNRKKWEKGKKGVRGERERESLGVEEREREKKRVKKVKIKNKK